MKLGIENVNLSERGFDRIVDVAKSLGRDFDTAIVLELKNVRMVVEPHSKKMEKIEDIEADLISNEGEDECNVFCANPDFIKGLPVSSLEETDDNLTYNLNNE